MIKLIKSRVALYQLILFLFLVSSGFLLSGCNFIQQSVLGGKDPTQITRNDLVASVWNIVRGTFISLGVIITIIVIYGGIQYMTALGNEEKLEKAKQTIFWAIAGLAIIISAFAIITYLLQKMGVLPGGSPLPNIFDIQSWLA